MKILKAFLGLVFLFSHSAYLVRTSIVHHQHVAEPRFRAQDLIEIGQQYLPVRGWLDGHGGDHTAGADGAQNGEDLPSAAGGGFMNAAPSGRTRIQPRHSR